MGGRALLLLLRLVLIRLAGWLAGWLALIRVARTREQLGRNQGWEWNIAVVLSGVVDGGLVWSMVFWMNIWWRPWWWW